MNIKLLFLFGLILAFYPSSAFSQRNKPANENNLYYKALVASLEKFAELDKTLKSKGAIVGDDCGDRMCADYHDMIVQKNDFTEGLPAQFGEYKVEYLDTQGLVERAKKLKKEFPILIGHAIENDGERLTISFTFHWISYKKRSLLIAISDWSTVFFRYDCEKRDFVIDEVKLGGI